MQLSIVHDKYARHARHPWLVVLPARLSDTGKRKYHRFATRSAAADFVASVRQRVRREGERPLAILSAQLAADAAAAAQLLAGTGLTLRAAVQQLLDVLHHTGAALHAALQPGGQGESIQATAAAAPPAAPLTLPRTLAMLEAAKPHQRTVTTRTRRSAISTLLRRNPGLADLPLSNYTPATIQTALDTAWPDAPPSWNGGRRALCTIFSFAIRRQLVKMPHPVSPLEQRHTTEAEIRAIPADTLRALLAACRPATPAERQAAAALPPNARRAAAADTSPLRAYVAICALAGVRPTECQSIRWQDIDFEDNILSVRVLNSKTGGQRHIELHPALRAWLLSVRPAGVDPAALVTPVRNIARLMQTVRQRAGFGAENPWQNDCLRHSYATYYLKARIGNITQLQLNMGHRSAHLLYTRYTNMAGVTRAAAEAWWAVLPD